MLVQMLKHGADMLKALAVGGLVLGIFQKNEAGLVLGIIAAIMSFLTLALAISLEEE